MLLLLLVFVVLLLGPWYGKRMGFCRKAVNHSPSSCGGSVSPRQHPGGQSSPNGCKTMRAQDGMTRHPNGARAASGVVQPWLGEQTVVEYVDGVGWRWGGYDLSSLLA